MARLIILLTSGWMCIACAIIPEQVNVNYKPDPAVAVTRVDGSPEVQLQVTDARNAESASWIADKKNGYGMRMASVMAQRPVAELVKEAVTQELVARGVRVGGGRTGVTMEVTRLESVYQNRFFSVGAIGSAMISVQVKRPDGNIAFARNFIVTNDDQASLLGTPSQARESVESALSKIVGQIVGDASFIAALRDSSVPKMS